mmetsp:Transcript_616/g.1431  ORF Transcript_616/g.1431 Transcript_616/m.1431 type:complete len:255 (+) Transcript_616:50-814(+)
MFSLVSHKIQTSDKAAPHLLGGWLGRRLLQLQQQGWVLDLHQRVHVRQPRLHQRQAALDGVVAVGDLLPHHVLGGRQEVEGQQLHELVLHVLDEVQAGAAVAHHDEHGEVRVRLLDAVVEVAHDYPGVLRKVHHQLLPLLQRAEAGVVQVVRVVEEQVGLAAQLHPHGGVRVVLPDAKDLHLDGLQRAHLLRLLHAVRAAQLEGHLALVEDAVALRQARVHLLQLAEVHRALQRRRQRAVAQQVVSHIRAPSPA